MAGASVLLALSEGNAGAVLPFAFAALGESTERASDPGAVCAALERPGGPRLALIDCDLPGEGGLALCRRVRGADAADRPYLILLSLAASGPDAAAALASGADDYLSFPLALDELLARAAVGRRTLAFQQGLLQQVRERHSPPLLAVCVYCKGARAGGAWRGIEEVLAELGQECTHTICPACYDIRVAPELAGLSEGGNREK